MSQLDLVKTVKNMGFDAVEFTDLVPPKDMSEQNFAVLIREECDKYSLPVANYTVGADFLNTDDIDAEVERLRKKLDIAKILGAKGLRHDASVGYRDERAHCLTFYDALPVIADGCRRVTEYAASLGIVTMIENHGHFCQESARVEKIVSAVGNGNFGLLVDIGNFLCADDDPITAVGRVAPFARHVHVKDFHIKGGSEPDPGRGWFLSRGGTRLRGAVLGHGNVPVKQCIGILKRSGYDGYLSIEFEGMEQNIPALEIGLENLKRYMYETDLSI